jgi:5-(carboxyamino)imidazole ribonucleotide mutase
MGEPSVGIIMGSQSDWPTLREAAAILDELGVAYEARIVSAHRTPDRLWDYGKTAVDGASRSSSRARAGRRICRA